MCLAMCLEHTSLPSLLRLYEYWSQGTLRQLFIVAVMSEFYVITFAAAHHLQDATDSAV